jgi:hypothetical protein
MLQSPVSCYRILYTFQNPQAYTVFYDKMQREKGKRFGEKLPAADIEFAHDFSLQNYSLICLYGLIYFCDQNQKRLNTKNA